jgi:hypothetical protein
MSAAFKSRHFAFVLLSALALNACQKENASDAPSSTTAPSAALSPDQAIASAIKSFRNNDLMSILSQQLPSKELEQLRTKWKADMAAQVLTDDKREQFAKAMSELTADDAETKIMAQIEPWLVQFEKETAAQMPMLIGMGKGLITQGISENKDLTEDQKQQARQNIDGLANWIGSIKLTDRALIKQAITQVVAAAREFNCKTLDEFHALSFDEAMGRFSVALKALKSVLATYGLDINRALDTSKVSLVSQEADTAKVRVSYEMFNQPTSFEIDLKRVDNHWYNIKMLEKLEEEKANSQTQTEPKTP